MVRYSSCGEPSRGATLSSSQPSSTLSPPLFPLEFWQLKDHPSGVPQGSFKQVGQFSCLSLQLCTFPNSVHWGVKEGNPRQLLLNLLIPILESVSERKGPPTSWVSYLYLHLENWKPFSLLACLPVPYGMDNNAGRGLPGDVDDSVFHWYPLSSHSCPGVTERGGTVLIDL